MSIKDYLILKGRKIFRMEKGQGPDTILVHGFPDRCENMERIFYPLSKHHRVIAYDQMGAGLSDKPKGIVYGLERDVEELKEIMDHYQMKDVHLLGHSIGGTICVKFAAQYPERVRSIVLLNPALRGFKIQTGQNYIGAWFLQWPILGEIMMLFHFRFMTKQCLKLAFHDSSKMTEKMVDRYHDPFKMKGANSSYIKKSRHVYKLCEETVLDLIERVKDQEISSLFVWTENDWSMPIEEGRNFAKKMSGDLYPVPKCGHSPHLELDDSQLSKHVLTPIQSFWAKVEKDKQKGEFQTYCVASSEA